MTPYKKILIWENKRRLKRVYEFRALLLQYFHHSRAESIVNERIEKPEAQEARVKINRMIDEIHDILLYSGAATSVRYTPPAAVGGYTQNIDLVQNVFHLDRFQISPTNLMDVIDRGIGIYETDRSAALLRTINPFFYLGVVLDWIVRVPFLLLGRAGFDQQKVEMSFVGRVIKGTIYIVTALASLLTVLQLLDYLESVKPMVKSILKM